MAAHRQIGKASNCEAYLEEAGKPNSTRMELDVDQELSEIYHDPLMEHYVKLFFRYIHDTVLTIFHKPTFMRLFHSGKTKNYILYAIAALAARYSSDPSLQSIDPRDRGASYFETGSRLLKLSIDDINIDTIHGCMLIAHYLSGYNCVEQEAIYVGVAIRVAHLLRLQEEPDTGDAIQDEVRRRAWSILFAADRWSALGNRIPRITGFEYRTDREPARKPMPDIDFLQLTSDSPRKEHTLGIWAPNRDLHDIASSIHTHQLAVLYEPASPEASLMRIDEISMELQRWQKGLPPNFKFNSQNIYLQSSLTYGAIFLGTHLSYHYNYVVLLYQFLSYSDDQSRRYAEQLEYHASKISEIIRWSNKVPNCKLLYSVVAHILVISSSVHLHTLLYGDSKAAKQAKDDLDTNFEHIMTLRGLWPAVDVSAARLRLFEAACLTSNQNTWRMDRWLVKFLLHHTTYMDEDRRDEPLEPLTGFTELPRTQLTPTTNINNQPNPDDSSSHRIVEQALSWLLTADPSTGYPQDLFIFDSDTAEAP
ncbi:hypothetical protein Unana1_07264 [Umbelopsis nana]